MNQTFTTWLYWLWDLMDISENLKRAKNQAVHVGNDFLTSGIHFLAFLVLSMVTGAMAWHFDLESTIIGISTLQQAVIPNLPSAAQSFSGHLAVGFSVAPTLIEIFTATFAKVQIKILQIFVVGLTAFDAITDIPRAIGFTNSLQAHFDQLGPIFGWITYWMFFFFWLFLSTIGFELGFIIFGFLTITFFFKAFNMQKEARAVKFSNNNGNKNNNKNNNKEPAIITLGDD